MPPETDSYFKWADGDGHIRFISNQWVEAPTTTTSKRYDFDPQADWDWWDYAKRGMSEPSKHVLATWCQDHALWFKDGMCPRCDITQLTCMWCAKGPFINMELLEAHEASCDA